MTSPYKTKPPIHFWRTAVAEPTVADVTPIPAKRFLIERGALVATAGSCFAQHVAKTLRTTPGVAFLEAEPVGPEQPMFSAAYGNIYTVRQLLQLFQEAVGGVAAVGLAWQRSDGQWIDPFRPTIYPQGFPSAEAVASARVNHINAVRRVFADCSVFVFTLGLTEAWRSASTRSVYPVPPGVIDDNPSDEDIVFHNFSYDEIMADLEKFVSEFGRYNAKAKIILTVSPVPLVATYTDEHVLVATVRSKSILRAVCDEAERRWKDVFYFPSFEIVSSVYNMGAYFEKNKRSVTEDGVAHVMRVFKETYLAKRENDGKQNNLPKAANILDKSFEGGERIICDEELFAKNLGF